MPVSLERIGKEQQAHEIIQVITAAIDLYWENLFEPPENMLGVNVREQTDGGDTIQDSFTIQRIYDTAYFIKCQRSSLKSIGRNCPIMNSPLETLEFRILPSLREKGQLSIRHIDPNNLTVETEISIDKLATDDPQALRILERLQLNLISLLVGHSKEKTIFDPFPQKIKALLEEAYGSEAAIQLWSAGMSDSASV